MYRFNEAAERELTTPIGPAAAGFGRRAFHEIARFFQAVEFLIEFSRIRGSLEDFD